MNLMALKLHLKTTRYTNPHGLADKANHSTALELAQLSSYAMKNPIVREIVARKAF
jgi:D-alanyl-D-alanine carboxypeptidase (penicillin-binding protein 5/6)